MDGYYRVTPKKPMVSLGKVWSFLSYMWIFWGILLTRRFVAFSAAVMGFVFVFLAIVYVETGRSSTATSVAVVTLAANSGASKWRIKASFIECDSIVR